MHFLALGAVLFGVYALTNRGPAVAPTSRQIVLTLDDLRQMQITFAAKWQRPPTQREMIAMFEDRVREEILYREALAMGLDKDDTIVKRRMAQKMEFLAADVSGAHEPTPQELRSWYEKNGERFSQPGRVTLHHLYFSPDRRGARAKDDAAKALRSVSGKRGDDPAVARVGDPFMFQSYLADRDPSELAKEFGPGFARGVFGLAPGSWLGPIESGYGWHLVFVDAATPLRVPTFEEIQPEVTAAWKAEQHSEAARKAYEAMRAKYQLIVPAAPVLTPGADGPEMLPP